MYTTSSDLNASIYVDATGTLSCLNGKIDQNILMIFSNDEFCVCIFNNM